MSKRACITGGAGFLGNALINVLLQENWEVVALAHKRFDSLAKLPVSVIHCPLHEVDDLSQAMSGCQALFHLAAMVSFRASDRAQLHEVNVAGTVAALKAAHKAGVARAVITSSACTLGTRPSPTVVDESIPCAKQWREHNVYLDSKAAQEEATLQFNSPEMETVILNPTTVFGPGDWSLNSGTIIKVVKQGRLVPVPPGGTSTIDVEDVAAGILAAFKEGRPGERYVLTAQNLTFYQVYQTIADVLGRRPLFVPLPKVSRPILELAAKAYGYAAHVTGRNETLITPQIVGDAFEYKWYSAEKAQRELQWSARYCLAESVERALRFYHEERLL